MSRSRRLFPSSSIVASGLFCLIFSASGDAAAESVTLHSVVVDEEGAQTVTVTYRKDFGPPDTCAHLLTPSFDALHCTNHFCASGVNPGVSVVEIEAPLDDFAAGTVCQAGNTTPGIPLEVKLCHGNNLGICSPLVTVFTVPPLGDNVNLGQGANLANSGTIMGNVNGTGDNTVINTGVIEGNVNNLANLQLGDGSIMGDPSETKGNIKNVKIVTVDGNSLVLVNGNLENVDELRVLEGATLFVDGSVHLKDRLDLEERHSSSFPSEIQ